MPRLRTYVTVSSAKPFFSSESATRCILDNIALLEVNDIKTEIRTKVLPDGTTSEYTALIYCLEGTYSVHDTNANARQGIQDAPPTRQQEPRSTNRTQTNSNHRSGPTSEAIDGNEVEEVKKALESKAEEALKRQLKKHNDVHDQHVQKLSQRYENILQKTLNAVQVSGSHREKAPTLWLSDVAAAKMLSSNPGIFKEYQDLCTRSLENYQADLKSQYRKHIDEIELECRDWLKCNAGTGRQVGVLDGLDDKIAKAKQFEPQVPEIAKNVGTLITMEDLKADKERKMREFDQLAAKDMEDEGLSHIRQDVQLEPLFQDDTAALPEQVEGPQQDVQESVRENVPMVGVPAALLPMYGAFAAQGVASRSIMDRNDAPCSATATQRTSHGSNSQLSAAALQSTNGIHSLPVKPPYATPYGQDFNSRYPVPSNLPYVSPYVNTAIPTQNSIRVADGNRGGFTPINAPSAPSAKSKSIHPTDIQHLVRRSQKAPTLIASNGWYGPRMDRFKAIRAPSTSTRKGNMAKNTQDSVVASRQSNQPKLYVFNVKEKYPPAAKVTDPNEYVDESLYDEPDGPSVVPTLQRQRAKDDADHGTMALRSGPPSPPSPWIKDHERHHFNDDIQNEEETEVGGVAGPSRSKHFNGSSPKYAISISSGDTEDEAVTSADFHVHKQYMVAVQKQNEAVDSADSYVHKEYMITVQRQHEAWAATILQPEPKVMSANLQSIFQQRFKGKKISEIMAILRAEQAAKRKIEASE